MVYEEINPGMWTPENDGDLIEGILVDVQINVGTNNSMLYSIQTSEGIKNVWGSAILDSRIRLIQKGKKVKITYKGLGDKKGGNNPPKIFKVEVDDGKEPIQPKITDGTPKESSIAEKVDLGM